MTSGRRAKERSLLSLQNSIVGCELCPRLVRWRRKVAEEKTARFSGQEYWGRPVPAFGDAKARLLVVGLAPAAHGANRTGRMFTGDRSGEWLYRALHRFGFSDRPVSLSRQDGLELRDCCISAALRCAPPLNKPSRDELLRCRPYLVEELRLLTRAVVVVGLGRIAFDSVVDALRSLDAFAGRGRPRFGHGVEVPVSGGRTLIASYHPSQQNTFTGKLTEKMFDAVFRRARELLKE